VGLYFYRRDLKSDKTFVWDLIPREIIKIKSRKDKNGKAILDRNGNETFEAVLDDKTKKPIMITKDVPTRIVLTRAHHRKEIKFCDEAYALSHKGGMFLYSKDEYERFRKIETMEKVMGIDEDGDPRDITIETKNNRHRELLHEIIGKRNYK